MEAITAMVAPNGCITFPCLVGGIKRNIIVQWFGAATVSSIEPATVNFPIAFPNTMFRAFFGDASTGAIDLSSTLPNNLAGGRGYYTGSTKTTITVGGYGGFDILAVGW